MMNYLIKPLTKKNAQITAFIIIGILTLAIISIAIIFRNNLVKSEQSTTADYDATFSLSIENSIQSCVEKVSSDALRVVGERGFYYEIPEELEVAGTSLWMYKTINIIPSSFRFIEHQLKEYIEDNLPFCPPFFEFKNQGWDIGEFTPSAEVRINENDVSFDVEYDLIISKDDFSKDLRKNNHIINANLREMYGFLAFFTNTNLLNSNFDFNNPLLGFSSEGYSIRYSKVNDTILKFTVIDLSGNLSHGEPLSVSFAAEFDYNEYIREYEKGSYLAVSPDRLATLFFPEGSEIPISIRAYFRDKITREKTMLSKFNANPTGWTDVDFSTTFPIYRFGPNGAEFEFPPSLTIWLNKDQRELEGSYSLLYNGISGWIPFPHDYFEEEGILKTAILGFSEFTPYECLELNHNTFSVTAHETQNVFSAYMPVIMVVAAIALAILAPYIIASFYGAFGGSVAMAGGTAAAGTAGAASAAGGMTVATVFTGGMTVITASSAAMATVANIALAVIYTASAALALSAYSGFEETFDTEQTMVITAVCDSEMNINPMSGGGDCKCMVGEAGSPGSSVSGGYAVSGGNTYTVRAVATLKMFQTSATCTCDISGSIVSSVDDIVRDKAREEALENPPPPTMPGTDYYTFYEERGYNLSDLGLFKNFVNSNLMNLINNYKENFVHAHQPRDLDLGCCINKENFCFDNYFKGYCVGDLRYKSCVDIPECPEYINLSGFYDGLFSLPTKEYCTFIMGTEEPDLDIYITGMDYETMGEFATDLNEIIFKIMQGREIGNINYYRVERMLNSSEEFNIREFAEDQCMGIANNKLVLILNPNKNDCEHHINLAETTPEFIFNERINEINYQDLAGDFCFDLIYLEEFSAPEIKIYDVVHDADEAEFIFWIESSFYPVNYTFYTRDLSLADAQGIKIPNSDGFVNDSERITQRINLPGKPSASLIYLTATNSRGITSYSNDESIIVYGVDIDFSSISPLHLSATETFNLQDYLNLFESGDVDSWEYSSNRPNCVSVQQTENQGWFNLIPESDSNCEATITVKVTTEYGYNAQGNIVAIIS